MTKKLKNVGASVRSRLLELSKTRGDDFQLVLVRYVNERLLYRIASSPHAKTFILKGAALFTIWTGWSLIGRSGARRETDAPTTARRRRSPDRAQAHVGCSWLRGSSVPLRSPSQRRCVSFQQLGELTGSASVSSPRQLTKLDVPRVPAGGFIRRWAALRQIVQTASAQFAFARGRTPHLEGAPCTT